MAIGPICHMTIDEKTSLSIRQNDSVHYFCGRGSLEKFAREQGTPEERFVSVPQVLVLGFIANKFL